MTIQDNEKKCCDAVIKCLEEWEKGVRSDLKFPEVENHAAPVEITCTIGKHLYALEHTTLESYKSQISDSSQLSKALTPVANAVNLPNRGMYWLTLPINSFSFPGLDNNQIRQKKEIIRDRLIQWINDTAPKMEPTQPHVSVPVSINWPDIPFVANLWCMTAPEEYSGKLNFSRSVPIELDSKRDASVSDRLVNKTPKLKAWKQEGGISVLILEIIDIALADIISIAGSLKQELSKIDIALVPDDIYIVDTRLEDEWTVYPYKRGEVIYCFDGTRALTYEDFNPCNLDNLQ